MWNGHNHILTGNEPFLGLVFSYFNKKRLPHNQLNRLIVQQPLCLRLRKLLNLYSHAFCVGLVSCSSQLYANQTIVSVYRHWFAFDESLNECLHLSIPAAAFVLGEINPTWAADVLLLVDEHSNWCLVVD